LQLNCLSIPKKQQSQTVHAWLWGEADSTGHEKGVIWVPLGTKRHCVASETQVQVIALGDAGRDSVLVGSQDKNEIFFYSTA
jgi:hypothetical protein